ncbi:hypothetical protein [Rhizobium sp. SSA_523]|uniref:hypothetical protein n=1 Tax=Rhizobium sp. SSA_523 TaxID=2952477 RepID=UPI002090DDC1|nr:hypothetical protein [Rhizobium sp. SSA_523]MCO5730223.1 hypothetical protein [Rhizobium sp. SSA_523]WKC25281.1 hypothetical protein QTJ18_14985 [Rhizobium sp. SSA_523]
MRNVIGIAIAALIGASTVVFAEDLAQPSDGRLSIHSPGVWLSQTVSDQGRLYRESYQVQPDHTLRLMDRASLAR